MEKKVPKLRFTEFISEWGNIRLGDICEIKGRIGFRGYKITDLVRKGDGAITLSPSNIIEDKLVIRDVNTYISLFKYEESPEIKVYNDDIIFVKTGSTVGKVAIVKNLVDKATLNPQFVVLKKIKINNDFLYLSMILRQFQEQVIASTGGGVVPTLTQKDMAEYTITVPSLKEQTKIASFLTSVDRKIEILEKQLELQERHKKGMMQKLFSQEIRFKDDSGEEFPEWEEKRLGEVVLIDKGEQLNKSSLFEHGDYPCINGGILPSGYTNKFNRKGNTITISEGGNSCGYINFITSKFWSGGHCYTISVIDSNKIENKYLYFALKNKEIEIKRLRVGSGLPNIQKGNLLCFEIPICKINEQKKIANFLMYLDEKIESAKKQIEAAKQWKKGLLQQMFV